MWIKNFQIYNLDVQEAENQRSNCQHPLDRRESKDIPEKNIYFIDYAKAFDCMDHNNLKNS